MKNKIIEKLIAVINVLNNISVSGKANLANLSGSIAVMEEVVGMLTESEIRGINEGKQAKK